jgi:excisionase family DNA binding protein
VSRRCVTPCTTIWGVSTQTPTRDGAVMLTPADAARLARVSRDTIYREIERGSLRALHVGGRLLRIDPTDFRRWLEGETE